MTDTTKTDDHDTEEKFCPGCYDYRPGTVTEHNGGRGGIVEEWECLACGHSGPLDKIPHDADEYEQMKADQITEDVRREAERGPFK